MNRAVALLASALLFVLSFVGCSISGPERPDDPLEPGATSQSLQSHSRPVREPTDTGSWFEPAAAQPGDDSGFGRLDPDALLELLRAQIASKLEAQPGSFLRLGSGYLAIAADGDSITATEKMLQALQDRWLINTELRAVVELAENDGGALLGARGAAGPLLHSVAVPALAGREAVLFRGLETTELATLGMEVAQEAAATDPHVRNVQSGLWLSGTSSPSPQGLWLSCLLQDLVHSEPARRPVESGGNLALGASEQTRSTFAGELAAGKELMFGDGPGITIDGRSYGSTLRLRGGRR